jgi:hypothetical protein
VGGPEISKALRVGGARYQTNPTMLVAPYYGADQGGSTGGWKPEFVDRIRRCEYPQYLWEKLPIGGRQESILRLDHLQPLGRHGESFQLTKFALSPGGVEILDEWIEWLFLGQVPQDGTLEMVRPVFLG